MPTATQERRMTQHGSRITPEQHEEAIRNLEATCQQMQFSVSWFPCSRIIRGDQAERMADAVSAKSKSVRSSKKLLSVKHPALKTLRAAKAELENWRRAFSIIKVGGGPEEENDGDITKTVAGVRLIRTVDIPVFEEGFNRRRDELMASAQAATRYLTESYYGDKETFPPILEMERTALAELYDEANYPKDFTKAIQVTNPTYAPYAPSVLLPPSVLAREQRRITEELNQTLELVVERLARELDETFGSIAALMVQPQKVYPDKNGPLAKYHGADLADRRDFPNGTTRISVTYTSEGKSVTEWLDPVPTAEYQSTFRPLASDKKRVIRAAHLNNLMTQLENFGRIKSMLGVHGTELDRVLSSLMSTLNPGNSPAETLRENIKSDRTYCMRTREAINEARNGLTSCVESVQAVRRVVARRNLNGQDSTHA